MTKRDRSDVDRLQAEIAELFSDLWQVPRFAGLRRGFRPDVDCFRTEDPPQFTIVVELPGVDPADVRIDASARSVVITGERGRAPAAGRVYQQIEIEHGLFRREIPLPADVDTTGATATYDRGLLTIVLPLASKPPRPVKVPIEVEARP